MCAYRVSDAHTDYRRLPQSFHCCSLSFRTSTTPPRSPRPSSRPPRHRTRRPLPTPPHHPIRCARSLISRRRRQSSGVNRTVRTDVVVRVPRTHTYIHTRTHTHINNIYVSACELVEKFKFRLYFNITSAYYYY